MAQSNPQASYTDPQQPRRSSRLPKPAYRDPNFIYEDLQRQLDNFDDVDERYLLPSPSLFSDLQDHDRKETKRKVKRASSKQPTKYQIRVVSLRSYKASFMTSIFTI